MSRYGGALVVGVGLATSAVSCGTDDPAPCARQVDASTPFGELRRCASEVVAVDGDLFVPCTSSESLSFSHLEEVSGNLVIPSESCAGELSFPKLVEIGGDLRTEVNTASGRAGNLVSLRLPALREIVGGVRIVSQDRLEDVELPALETVRGDVELWANSALRRVDLSLLREVGGTFLLGGGDSVASWRGNPFLEEVSLRSLETVEGSFVVSHSARLETLRLPALNRVGDRCEIDWNAVLGHISASALRSVGKLRVTIPVSDESPVGGLVDFSSLESAGDVYVDGGFADEIDIGSLVQANELWIDFFVGAVLRMTSLTRVDALRLTDTPNLAELDLPQLGEVGTFVLARSSLLGELRMPVLKSADSVLVRSNDALTTLSLPALESAQDITVRDNPVLPLCAAEALAAQVGTECDCQGNADTACSN